MNERIRELAEQCYEEFQTLTSPKYLVFNKEKFAELIVRDCLTQVAMIGISNFEDDDSGNISWTVGKCIEMIKNRFEIKE
jgi:hypothetical protein